ncbi:MAG: hypothetical protein WAL22_17885 [Solirubrobacteraceae bacterium]
MADKAMDVYLNDHLAGATLGSDLARQIRDQHENSPLGDRMRAIAPQIEEDRQTLIALMQRMGTSRNPVKQATAWATEKASHAKFRDMTSGEPGLGTFMAVESLALGVLGKLSLWRALARVADQYSAIASVDLDELIDRARAQYDLLEHERLTASSQALRPVQNQTDAAA